MMYMNIHLFIPVSGLDYESISTILTFTPCQRITCVIIPIIDDCIVEHSGETFNVYLLGTPVLDDRIMHTIEPAVVNITDNDGGKSVYISLYFIFLWFF